MTPRLRARRHCVGIQHPPAEHPDPGVADRAAVPAVLTGSKHGAGTAHSVAAAGNFVYVPLPANTDYPNCSKGCVAVFSAQ